jgi:CubicO group peptidase (beta-lactamase class C family)
MTDLRSLVIESSRRHGLGGVAIAVVGNGDRPVIECLGLADRASGRRVSPDTVFQIASISKTVTAVGLMHLRDQGLFQLDDPVNHYLKGLRVEPPRGGAEVTFRHLLTHTSGVGELPRVSDFVRRDAWGVGPPYSRPTDLVDLYGGALRTEVAAGSKWAYANHGFAVVGKLVADIADMPFVEYMGEHVLRPLGMADTDCVRTERVSDELATGYHWIRNRFTQVTERDATLLGPGSVFSSLTDMAKYSGWLLGGGPGTRGDVLAPDTLDEMMSPQFTVDDRLTTSMGLAFFLDRFGTHRICGHDGNNPGFASALLVAPDDGVGVVVMTNTSTFGGAHLLAGSVLRSQLGVTDPADVLPPGDVPACPHMWPELTGAYAPKPGFLTNARLWQVVGGEVQVCVRSKRLLMRALSPVPHLRRGVELHPIDDADPLRFAVSIEGLVVQVAFGTDDAGRVDHLCIGAPAMATLHRRPAWRSSRRRLSAVAAASLALAAIECTQRR